VSDRGQWALPGQARQLLQHDLGHVGLPLVGGPIGGLVVGRVGGAVVRGGRDGKGQPEHDGVRLGDIGVGVGGSGGGAAGLDGDQFGAG
jgi:hypothetical protein